jgi:hypothetical protein
VDREVRSERGGSKGEGLELLTLLKRKCMKFVKQIVKEINDREGESILGLEIFLTSSAPDSPVRGPWSSANLAHSLPSTVC